MPVPGFRLMMVSDCEPTLRRDSLLTSSGDIAQLPADFSVWLASPEAAFLDKRFIWANWDVDGIKAKKEEILAHPQLFTVYLNGYPEMG